MALALTPYTMKREYLAMKPGEVVGVLLATSTGPEFFHLHYQASDWNNASEYGWHIAMLDDPEVIQKVRAPAKCSLETFLAYAILRKVLDPKQPMSSICSPSTHMEALNVEDFANMQERTLRYVSSSFSIEARNKTGKVYHFLEDEPLMYSHGGAALMETSLFLISQEEEKQDVSSSNDFWHGTPFKDADFGNVTVRVHDNTVIVCIKRITDLEVLDMFRGIYTENNHYYLREDCESHEAAVGYALVLFAAQQCASTKSNLAEDTLHCINYVRNDSYDAMIVNNVIKRLRGKMDNPSDITSPGIQELMKEYGKEYPFIGIKRMKTH